jgi:hypothetical protein
MWGGYRKAEELVDGCECGTEHNFAKSIDAATNNKVQQRPGKEVHLQSQALPTQPGLPQTPNPA